MRRLLIPFVALATVACGGYQGTVNQKVTLKHGDVANGTVANEHEISADDTNWSAFVNDAKTNLGRDVASIDITSVALQLDTAKAKNVGQLEDVLRGDVVVFVKVKETNALYDIAKVTDPKGTGKVELDTLSADLTPDQARLAKGQFSVGVRGNSVKSQADDFEAPLLVTLGVEAK